MGGGGEEDHEELKIFLLNHFILSRFNQELRNKEGDTSVFKGRFLRQFQTI